MLLYHDETSSLVPCKRRGEGQRPRQRKEL